MNKVIALSLMLLAWPVAADLKWYDQPGRWFKSVTGTAAKGDVAPETLGVTLTGVPVTVADSEAPYTLLVFWASWCPKCQVEMPEVAALQERYDDGELQVFAVNVMDKEADARRYVERNSYPFTYLLDTAATAEKQYAISSLPTTILVRTKDAMIMKRWVGKKDVPKIERLLGNLLAAESNAQASR